MNVGLFAADPQSQLDVIRASYHHADKSSNYVTSDDTHFLKDKFYPQGTYNLVDIDLASEAPTAKVVGWRTARHIPWKAFTGVWTGARQVLFTTTFLLLTTYYFYLLQVLFTATFNDQFSTYYLLLTTHYLLLPATYYLLLTTGTLHRNVQWPVQYLVLTTYYSLLTTT